MTALVHRYMEGRVTAAESRAAAAAVQAASVPVQQGPQLEPQQGTKRPAPESGDEVVLQHIMQKQRFLGEMGMLQQTVDTSAALFITLEAMEASEPASQQLVQTLRANTIARVGAAAENAQIRAIQGASGSAIAAPDFGADALASDTVTVMGCAYSIGFYGDLTSAKFLDSVGSDVSKAWQEMGRKSIVFEGQTAMEYGVDSKQRLPFLGNLSEAMHTHRVKFTFGGPLEVDDEGNMTRHAWVYPQARAESMIVGLLRRAQQASLGAGHAPISNRFAPVA